MMTRLGKRRESAKNANANANESRPAKKGRVSAEATANILNADIWQIIEKMLALHNRVGLLIVRRGSEGGGAKLKNLQKHVEEQLLKPAEARLAGVFGCLHAGLSALNFFDSAVDAMNNEEIISGPYSFLFNDPLEMFSYPSDLSQAIDRVDQKTSAFGPGFGPGSTIVERKIAREASRRHVTKCWNDGQTQLDFLLTMISLGESLGRLKADAERWTAATSWLTMGDRVRFLKSRGDAVRAARRLDSLVLAEANRTTRLPRWEGRWQAVEWAKWKRSREKEIKSSGRHIEEAAPGSLRKIVNEPILRDFAKDMYEESFGKRPPRVPNALVRAWLSKELESRVQKLKNEYAIVKAAGIEVIPE